MLDEMRRYFSNLPNTSIIKCHFLDTKIENKFFFFRFFFFYKHYDFL